MCAFSELQFSAFRENGGTREAGSTVTESLVVVVLYRMGKHQIRRRRRAARSSTSQGRAEPLCTRIKGANRDVSERKADVWPRSFFFLRGPQGAANGQDSLGFSRMHRNLDGWMLARAPTSPAQGLHHHGPRYVNFPYFCTMCGLDKFGLVDRNWLERNLSALCC